MRSPAIFWWLPLLTAASANAQVCELARLLPCDASPTQGDRMQLAADGNMVVVGTPGDDASDRSDADCNSGAVYVWRRDGDVWELEQKLTPADVPGPPTGCKAGFGSAVAIHGNRMVVGALDYFSVADHTGTAHVFRRDGTHWAWEDTLVPASSPIAPSDRYSWSVALGSEVAIVGSPGPGISGQFTRGRAFVFRRTGTEWEEEPTGSVQPTATDAFEFGTYVALDGERFVGGAARTPGFPWSGAAFVFRHELAPVSTWVQEADLRPTGLVSGYFGYGVAMQGDWIVVGAPLSGAGSSFQGAAVVFRHRDQGTTDPRDDTWVQTQLLVPASLENGYEAGAVALDGRRLALGAAVTGQGGFGTETGFVYPYALDDAGVWIEQPRIAPALAALGDGFGMVTAVSGELILASSGHATIVGLRSGAVYAFDASGATCADTVNEVPDATPPVIACPPAVTARAHKQTAVAVTFSVTATDECDPAPTVVCVPPSGSSFPWGTTTVSCTATDAAGNTTSCSFQVVVEPGVRRQ